MSARDRTTYHPAFYRVSFQTAAGLTWRDADTLPEARRIQRIERLPGWPEPGILACWYVDGQYALDTEEVR